MAQPALREQVFQDFQPCSSHRDAALVRLPPRFTELHGLRSALTLREHVQRPDFQARSWAALWGHRDARQRADALAMMTPENFHRATIFGSRRNGIILR
jgi:hypothetical protein